MMCYAVATVPEMIALIRMLIVMYTEVIEVKEPHALWDFTAWLEPHMCELRGFANGQFGDGIHEFLLSKDAQGIVRLYLRKSSQASTQIPEGCGYKVFSSDPGPGPPALAAFKEDRQW
eukprot:6213286-Pleurochrysis_carterae.AAC.4